MENNNQKTFPFFKVLYKNIVLIILITVLCALLSFGYSLLNKKTSVTVSQSVILRTAVSSSQGESQSTNASHGKIYINEIRDIITNPKAIEKINAYYIDVFGEDAGKISAGAIGVSSKENSLIFNISYTDKDEKVAFDKLTAIYTVANEQLIQEDIQAESAELILTDGTGKIFSVVTTSDTSKNIILGAIVGIVISVAIAFILYVLDNTVKDKDEFEELTGVSILAYLEKNNKK
ncbi:MAG: hypothetical protein J6C62_02535 [Clostridia bacterium]|nr:hypothetical protein [Clostridia bacterium]